MPRTRLSEEEKAQRYREIRRAYWVNREIPPGARRLSNLQKEWRGHWVRVALRIVNGREVWYHRWSRKYSRCRNKNCRSQAYPHYSRGICERCRNAMKMQRWRDKNSEQMREYQRLYRRRYRAIARGDSELPPPPPKPVYPGGKKKRVKKPPRSNERGWTPLLPGM